MESMLFAVLLLPLSCFLLTLALQGEAVSFESVPDLEKSMYKHIEGFPCVRLLNVSGEIGCSNPSHGAVIAPIVRLKDVEGFDGSAAILVSIEELESFFSRLSEDSDFSLKVAGVLVESSTHVQNDLNGFSPDMKFPGAGFAPYHNNTFHWNPDGSGIMWKGYNFPVFLLSESSTVVLEEVAPVNEKNKRLHAEVVAEFDLVMQTTKSGTHDSESCLTEGTCLPLGGYSVWSALPPINISSSQKVKPIIMTIASMDSASFFRDQSLGAESPISGLIALLAIVDSLSRIDGLDILSKQLVFAVFTGEAWGYLGSRRFFIEYDNHSDALEGLDLTSIEMVMEIGSVGKSSSENKTFFAHTNGDTSSMFVALRNAQSSLKTESVTVKMASASNPGVPPSSLMTFIRKNPNISGVVLEDFDSSFSNKFYHSHLDGSSNINSSSIVAAASLAARTLYIVAGGEEASVLNDIKINASFVEELVSCLLTCEPGLSCGLVERYISPSTKCPNHYVGVVLGDPSSSTNPSYVGDISRLVWNFLAEKTSLPSKNISSSCPNNCRGSNEVCIRQEGDGKGICVVSTTRYVPAYSTRLKYDSGRWTLLPANTSYVEDPVWTESNWGTIQVKVYKVQSTHYDHVILILGLIVTLLAYLVIIIARTFIRKVVKQD